MKRAIVLTWEKFQDHEVIYPYHALKEHGFDVTLAGGPNLGRIFGILGAHMVSDLLVEDLDPESIDDYDLLVIPGGVKAETRKQRRRIFQKLGQCRKDDFRHLQWRPATNHCGRSQGSYSFGLLLYRTRYY